MSYLQNDDQFLSNNDPMNSDTGDLTQDTFLTPGQSGPTPQSTNSSFVNPGSVGGSTGTGSGGSTPAWTNIQSYLKANPQQSPAVQGFAQQADQAVNKEKENANTYLGQKSALDSKRSYGDYATSFDPNAMRGQLQAQMTGKPYDPKSFNTIDTFMNTNFNDMSLQPYQTSNEYQQIRDIANNPTSFGNYVENQYDDAAGRKLTQGEYALQKQIDLSGGAFGDVRQTALERLSGLDPLVNQANEAMQGYGNDFATLEGYKNRQNELANAFKGSDSLYTRKYGEGRWNPETQRREEQEFSQMLQQAQQLADPAFRTLIGLNAGVGLQSPNATSMDWANRYGTPSLRNALETLRRPYQADSLEADQYLGAARNLGTFWQNYYNPSAKNYQFRDQGNQVLDAVNRYYADNKDTFQDTFY